MMNQQVGGIGWKGLWRIAFYAIVVGLLGTACSNNSYEGMIVAVKVPGDPEGSPEGAQLIAFDPGQPDQPVSLLSSGFESACAPSVSHDGRTLFFQGKKEGDEWWQIWMMDLRKKSAYRVTDLPDNCKDPVSLPDGTIIFSKSGILNNTPVSFLFRCNRDGSGLIQLTFNPSTNLRSTLLQEGRVLFTSSQEFPSHKTPELMVMRPDGTKSDLYFDGTERSFPVSRAIESEDGHVYFVESNGRLMRTLHRRPLFSGEVVAEELEGRFAAVFPVEDGRCLVSYQPTAGDPFAIYEIDVDSTSAPLLLYKGEGHLTDLVRIAPMKERPRILPSAVNTEIMTGLLMSKDINHSILPVNTGIAGDTTADRIRVSGLDGLLGEITVKEDGSFYLKTDADMPFRIETLNSRGETVRGPSDWIYLRPNERRGCVGCHADPELAPDNRQPLAVKDPPEIIQVNSHTGE